MNPSAEQRYSRQMLFTPVGTAGQEKIGRAKIAIVGMGALGTVLANHMVRSGTGYVRIIDRDFVEPSNLQRQTLFDEQDALHSTPKAIAAAERLAKINSSVTVDTHVADLNAANAQFLLSDVDLILDGTDNFAVRFLINDVAVKHHIPWIYGGAVRSRGVTMTIVPGETPCFRCLFLHPPAAGTTETCDTAGVISPIVDVIASYQSVEAMKLLVGAKQQLNRKMLQLDIWHNQLIPVDVSKAKKDDCPACALHRYDFLQAETDEDSFQKLCGRDSVQIQPARPSEIRLGEWAEKLKALGIVESNPFLLKFTVSEKLKIVLFTDGRAIVQGTSDPVEAKTLYSKYIGM